MVLGSVGGREGVWLRWHGHGVVPEGVTVCSEVGGAGKVVVVAADLERSCRWLGIGVGLAVASRRRCCGGGESIGIVAAGAEVVLLIEEGERSVGRHLRCELLLD